MANYHLSKKGELKLLPDTSFCEELEMQSIVENNIETLLGLQFIADEFTVLNRRFDTVAFDFKKKSFVILEYKKVVKDSVTDQGVAYWNLIQNNKDTMVDLYNVWANQYEMDNITEDDINWKEVKILLIAPGYTKYQQEAFLSDERIDLYVMYKVGKTNTLHFQQIENEIPIKNVNYVKALSKATMTPPTKEQKEMLKTRKEKEIENELIQNNGKNKDTVLEYGWFVWKYYRLIGTQKECTVDFETVNGWHITEYKWDKVTFAKHLRSDEKNELRVLVRLENLKMFKQERRLTFKEEDGDSVWYEFVFTKYSDTEECGHFLSRAFDNVYKKYIKAKKKLKKDDHIGNKK